jgi:hypothetical protein
MVRNLVTVESNESYNYENVSAGSYFMWHGDYYMNTDNGGLAVKLNSGILSQFVPEEKVEVITRKITIERLV